MQIPIEWDGKIYTFSPESDLTVQRLRVLKAAFGPDYGKYVRIMELASEGDADALVAVWWVMKSVAGEGVDPRAAPNFAVGEFMEAFDKGATAADQADPNAGAEDDGLDPTPASAAATPA